MSREESDLGPLDGGEVVCQRSSRGEHVSLERPQSRIWHFEVRGSHEG